MINSTEIIKTGSKDKLYSERVALFEGILLHSSFNKDLLKRLLKKTYPSEPENIQAYRESVFLPITKTYFDKVLATLKRAYTSDEFSYSIEPSKLEAVLDMPYGGCNNFFQWGFTAALKNILEDANGAFVTLDYESWNIINAYVGENTFDYSKNIVKTFFFNSKQIIAKTDVDCLIQLDNFYLYVTLNSCTVLYEEKGNIVEVNIINNTPVDILTFSVGNYVKEGLKESLISGVCPFWTQALIEFSDKQGAIKHHIYPEKWRIETGVCGACNGVGTITYTNPDGTKFNEICKSCDGTGHQPSGIYSELVITKDFLSGDLKPPFMGYVEKSLDAVEFISKDIENNIFSGLSAVNMEFLLETPLNQSGTAKEIDKSDVNHFIKAVGIALTDDVLVPIAQAVIFFNELMNRTNSTAFEVSYDINGVMSETYKKPLITITLPRNIDYTGSNNNTESIKQILESNLSQPLKKEAEKRFIKEQILVNSKDSKLISECIILDTLYGLSVQEKIQLFNTGVISSKELYISLYIYELIQQAVDKSGKSFFNKPYLTKQEIINSIYEERTAGTTVQKILE